MEHRAVTAYDAVKLAEYYDAFGDREWDRLETSLRGRISRAIHSAVLFEHVHSGMHVADIGCGPGRFAMAMIQAGAEVTLVDISTGQLRDAERRLTEAGLQYGIRDSLVLDICDLSLLDTSSFDAVVCFGGALSYGRERHEHAFAELVRIARPSAPILFSVMSLLGALTLAGPLDADAFLKSMPEHIDWLPPVDLPGLGLTLPSSDEFHLPMALFTAAYLRKLTERAGCEVLSMAAANPISRMGLPLDRISSSPEAASQLEALELAMARAPGMIDCGEHIVVAARKNEAQIRERL